jgi:hypothetical protein
MIGASLGCFHRHQQAGLHLRPGAAELAAGLTIGGLRLSKGWLLAQEYKHRAREGRIAE